VLAGAATAAKRAQQERGRGRGAPAARPRGRYSTVTDFARFRGWSTSVPFWTAVW
jgi:hypothetical protein